jgi:fumarylacetoacetase
MVPGAEGPRVVVAFEDDAADLAVLHRVGLLDDQIDPAVFSAGSLNALFDQGAEVWRAIRRTLQELLAAPQGLPGGALVSRSSLDMLLPVDIGDFVDGYGGLHHATNMGRILRPDSPALLPNWRSLPVAYHGRSGTVVRSGTPIVRPRGQILVDGTPSFAPSRRLDMELEVGCIVGVGNALGEPIDIANAADHLFGLVLVNDWSARDIQAFEYQPLGPFLAKSFATSISNWVVPMDAVAPYLVPGLVADQDPRPLPYLRSERPAVPDLHLEVLLLTSGMAGADLPAVVISQVEFAQAMYWSMTQQVAHATANGAATRPGDLFGSGTASGEDARHAAGSFMELSWGGTRPLELPNGETRCFLEDGDTLVLRGWCGSDDGGGCALSFGDVIGSVVPARKSEEVAWYALLPQCR